MNTINSVGSQPAEMPRSARLAMRLPGGRHGGPGDHSISIRLR
jgi:hypothetical protein